MEAYEVFINYIKDHTKKYDLDDISVADAMALVRMVNDGWLILNPEKKDN